jgi:hypothetical protein
MHPEELTTQEVPGGVLQFSKAGFVLGPFSSVFPNLGGI